MSLSHRLSNTRSYKAWGHAMSRCYNPKDARFPRYGARGIKVAKSWHRVENFFRDMGEVPPGMTLDRKNVNKGYSKSNCRWATAKEQQNNRENNIVITWRGISRTICQWAEVVGIGKATLWHRLRVARWPVDRAMTEAASYARRPA